MSSNYIFVDGNRDVSIVAVSGFGMDAGVFYQSAVSCSNLASFYLVRSPLGTEWCRNFAVYKEDALNHLPSSTVSAGMLYYFKSIHSAVSRARKTAKKVVLLGWSDGAEISLAYSSSSFTNSASPDLLVLLDENTELSRDDRFLKRELEKWESRLSSGIFFCGFKKLVEYERKRIPFDVAVSLAAVKGDFASFKNFVKDNLSQFFYPMTDSILKKMFFSVSRYPFFNGYYPTKLMVDFYEMAVDGFRFESAGIEKLETHIPVLVIDGVFSGGFEGENSEMLKLDRELKVFKGGKKRIFIKQGHFNFVLDEKMFRELIFRVEEFLN